MLIISAAIYHKKKGKKQIKFFLELHKLHVFFAIMSSIMLKNNYITFI